MSESVAAREQRNHDAREAAQRALAGVRVESTDLVEFQSRGRVVVIGGAQAQAFASALPAPLQAQTLLTSGDSIGGKAVTVTRLGDRPLRINGHLGAFVLQVGQPGHADAEILETDMILDLGQPPQLGMPMRPPGYLTSGTDEEGLREARAQLSGLVGTFDKPRYFSYDAALCAHGRSGQTACTRCIDVCPAEAISSLVEKVTVDSYLCQGGGACTMVCPSGAIRYRYPGPEDTLEQLRILLKTYREQGGCDPLLVLAVSDQGEVVDLPENGLLLRIEELASVGLECWLTALAYGARAVLLLDRGGIPPKVAAALRQQLVTVGELLEGMGYPAQVVRLADPARPDWHSGAFLDPIDPANFSTRGGKRQMIFMALDHLQRQAVRPRPMVSLTVGAPFGTAQVEADACTLCFSCVGACPGGALLDGEGEPRLRFIEANCLQCGLCTRTCPEDAIAITPRMLFDREARGRVRLLHEEEPFCCIECGEPFATRSVVDNMLHKLEGHWMFRDSRARRRLKMCQDCRVIDIAQDPEAMGQGVGDESLQ